MSHDEAAAYRQRATELRSMARQMRDTPSMELHIGAGMDTWYGPRADACMTELACAQQRMRHAADDLDAQAFQFDRRADELAATALRTHPFDGLGG